MPKNTSINLLPQEEFEASLLGRTLKWAMSTFRIIVIVTEMIVMAAFLSRFWLDAQNSELTSSIKVKSAQIEAQADLEKTFRDIQSKLSISKKIKDTPTASKKLALIASKLPPDVNLTGVSILENSTQIKGSSISEVGISQFVTNLKEEPTLKTVDLGQLNSSESNSLLTIFSITINY